MPRSAPTTIRDLTVAAPLKQQLLAETRPRGKDDAIRDLTVAAPLKR